ncbi:MAG: hypothetical protein ACI9WU_003370, partial [Myxococcota bacterium]
MRSMAILGHQHAVGPANWLGTGLVLPVYSAATRGTDDEPHHNKPNRTDR